MFLGGARRINLYVVAVAKGVTEAGLVAVVVEEFEDQPDENDFSKSVRFLERCASAIVDVSIPAGQYLELGLLYRSKIELLLLYSADRVDAPTTVGMIQGIADTIGAKLIPCTTTEQMTEEARAWCTSRTVEGGVRPVSRGEVQAEAERVQRMISGSNSQLLPTPSGESDFSVPDFGPPPASEDSHLTRLRKPDQE